MMEKIKVPRSRNKVQILRYVLEKFTSGTICSGWEEELII